MILDGQLQFSNAQDLTGSADVVSTNVIDLSEVREIGLGRVLYVATVVTLAFTDGGSNAGTNVVLYGGASAGTKTGLQTLFQIPQAAAVGSGPYFAQIYPGLIAGLPAHFQFLQLDYQPQTANLTAGKVSSYIVLDIQAFVAYKRGYTIS